MVRLRDFALRLAPSLFLRAVLSALCLAAGLARAQSQQLYSVFQNVGGTADETGRQMVQDASGNLFTLSTSGSGFVLAMRNNAGAASWKSYFPVEPSGLALTPDGGEVVVGRVDRGNSPTVRQIMTLKYDGAGNLQWTRTLNNVTTLSDPALRITAAPDGSIYLGATINQDAFSDVSLIKYSATGDLLWQQTKGPDPNQEICVGVALDPAGNILLYANRNPSGGGQPIIYKFGPDGTLIWTFVSSVSGVAYGFVMDATGASYLPVNGGSPAVLKVATGGTQVWKTSLGSTNAPLAIGLLGTNAFVAGVQTGTAKCFVQKIGTSGGVTWTATHTGPSGEAEILNSVAASSDGSVYAAGNRSFTGSAGIFTLKVGTTGVVAWSADQGVYTYTPPIIQPLPPIPPPPLIPTSIAINGGSQPVTFSTINGPGASTGYDTEVSVESTTGAPSALSIDDLNGTNETVDASATAADGTTFVLADTQQGNGADVVLQQILPDGTLGWLRGFGGAGPDLGYALSLEPDGGVAVTYGVFNSNSSMWDTKVRRFDATGNTLWTTALDGSVHVASMVSGPDNSVYLVGQDQGLLPNRFHTAKVNPDGSIAWSQVFSGAGLSDDFPFKIALDSLGNLFVCGNLWDGNRFLASLQRYDRNSGAVAWTATYASSGAGASGFTMAPDNHGGVYVFGTDWATGGRGLIRRYDNSGNLVFSRISTDTDTIGERYVSVAIDGAGNLDVAGSAVRPDKNVDLLAEQYNSNGLLIWKHLYDGPAGLNDAGKFLTLDSFGSIYVAGTVSGGSTGRDYALWKLNPDGSAAWPDSGNGFLHSAMIFDSGRGLADTVAGLSHDASGNVYLAGTALGPNNTYDINAMKFGSGISLNASLVNQSVPTSMIAGQSYSISFSFMNMGNTTWTSAGGIQLGIINPVDNTTWGLSRVDLSASDSIAPGATKKFSSFRVFAPTTGGTYNLQWSMRQTNLGPFGQPSINVPVVVTVAPNAARYIGQTSPSTVKAGSVFSATIKMRNVGTNTWTQAGGYALAPSNSPTSWGITQVLVSTNVAPGSDKQFSLSCKAPTTPGTYVFRFQMRNTSGFFGDVTSSKTITVTP